jgi:hypothetical protein
MTQPSKNIKANSKPQTANRKPEEPKQMTLQVQKIAYDPDKMALLQEIADSLQDSWSPSQRRKGRKIATILSTGQGITVNQPVNMTK